MTSAERLDGERDAEAATFGLLLPGGRGYLLSADLGRGRRSGCGASG